MEINKKTLNKVAGYRAMLGLNQTELGQYLGISKQAYSNKETGKRNFNDIEKAKIKELIAEHIPDITIDDIFFD